MNTLHLKQPMRGHLQHAHQKTLGGAPVEISSITILVHLICIVRALCVEPSYRRRAETEGYPRTEGWFHMRASHFTALCFPPPHFLQVKNLLGVPVYMRPLVEIILHY
jgi:hypothetical protein